MALTIEDGSNVANAESFISVADAEAYFISFDKDTSAWSILTTASKEGKLRSAGQYINNKYSFQGVQTNSDQLMIWPRNGVLIEGVYPVDADSVPTDVANAQALLALESLTNPLHTTLTAQDGNVKLSADAVGPLKSTVEYFGKSRSGTQVVFTEVKSILSPYLSGTNTLERS